MTTIKDIAKLAGVSKSTVSRVVSHKGFVKEETKAKILKVMKDLNYRPNIFAKGMRTNRSFSIGILFPDLSNPFFTEWYCLVDKISREKGYLNYICITDPKGESEEKRIEDLLSRSIDGIILFSYRKDEAFNLKLKQISQITPIVCCDSMFLNSGLSCVCANGEQGTYAATKTLIHSGRKRIAYIKGKKHFDVANNRYIGYKKALHDHGIALDQELVIESEFTRECGIKAAEKLMLQKNPPDAIMAATDNMAIGVLNYLNRNKYSVPQDIAVFGFDNLLAAETTTPPLSTISLPVSTLAKTSINHLINLIENPDQNPQQYVLDCELKVRESS